MVESRQNMPNPLIYLVVQVIDSLDLLIGVLLDLWLGFGWGDLSVSVLGIEGSSSIDIWVFRERSADGMRCLLAVTMGGLIDHFD